MAKKASNDGESIQGYFKRILRENPKLLSGRSNAELLERWAKDHPGQPKVSDSVKAGLQNAKSALRSKGRKRKAQRAAQEGGPTVPAGGRKKRPLVALEEQIDDCITAAKVLDRGKLEKVISLLRHARNEVVWMTGQ